MTTESGVTFAEKYRDLEFATQVKHATRDGRISTAISCHDSAAVPKVADAGCVFGKGDSAYQVMHNGLKVYCDGHYGEWNVEIIQKLKGHHEPQEEAVFHEVLKRIKPGSLIVELGAFWAYYSMWFLKAVKDSRAILVEPVLSQMEQGKRNFKLNNLKGEFLNGAISDRETESSEVDVWHTQIERIKTVTVDSLFRHFGLQKIEVLHSDIQGHEYAMLMGAQRALKDRLIDWILISTHGNYLHERCLRVIKKAGYHIVAEHNPDESFSFDGLIVASAKREIPHLKMTRRELPGTAWKKMRKRIRVNLLEPLGIKKKLF